MDDYKVPIIEPTIDYTKVPAINQKRTISFINHFIVHTVTYLNKFALSCEERLFEFENKLQRIEASLEILESWLSSVPTLEENHKDTKGSTESSIKIESEHKQEEINASKVDEPDVSQDEPKSTKTDEQPVDKDPRYEKYFKMVHVGVQREALKLQMEEEGLDPSVLYAPQQIVSKPKITDNGENNGD